MRKTILFFFFLILFANISFAQTPQGISYQAIARNAGGVPISNHSLQIKFSIVDSVVTGGLVYIESHNTTTNNFGLFSLTVGLGTPILNSFNNINWSKNNKYLKIEMDTNNTSNWILIGTQQMMSVPYSLWSANGLKAGTNNGDMLYWNGLAWVNIPVGTEGQVLTLHNNKPIWGSVPVLPSVTTVSINSINQIGATANGEVISSGTFNVTSRGFCWDTAPNPSINKSYSVDSNGVGIFSRTITGLISGRTYYLRAYATNNYGTAYGNEISFTTYGLAVQTPTNNTLFIVGNATLGGWNNPVPVPSQQFTKVSNTKYEITVPLSVGGEFLFLPTNGDWSKTYGSPVLSIPTTTSYQALFSSSNLNNFKAPPISGTYKISVDFSTGLYSVNKVSDTLLISFSKDTTIYDGFDTTAITVRDISGNDVTSSSTIYINGSIATSSTFIASSLANATVYATRNSLTSITRTIFVKAAGVSPFTKKILAEHCTGTWGGYEPRILYSLDNYIATKPNCIVMRIHGGGGTDPYKYQYYSTYNSAFSIAGYPSVVVNRKGIWSENTVDLDTALSKYAPLGLAIQSTTSGTNITGTVSVKFNVTTSKTMKIVIALVENGLVSSQTNYYSTSGGATPYLYGGVNPITNFNHKYILRTTSTNLFGDIIPSSSQVTNNIYSLPFTIPTTGVTATGTSYTVNPANCSIVAFVIDGTSDTKGVYNVQTAPVGTIKNFD